MLIDAVVLAGGRSSRLSGTPKAQLRYRGRTLLQHTIDAAVAAGARRIVVVGPYGAHEFGDAAAGNVDVFSAREEPAFGGPAAGIGAGVTALLAASAEHSDAASELTLVLACDLPNVAEATRTLTAQLPLPHGFDGVLLIDETARRQLLSAVYSSTALSSALAGHEARGPLNGVAVRTLLADLRLHTVGARSQATHDIDTWADAAAHGIDVPPEHRRSPHNREGKTTMTDHDDEDRVLTEWCTRLVDALDAHGLNVDLKAVLGLAGRAAHSVMRPAAPLTTFVVGYASGLATARGVEPDEAVAAAVATALRLTSTHQSGQPGGD